MPLYPYKCADCGHAFEEIQKFSDPPVERCPECGGKTEKQMGLSSFALKGGGWYRDGYTGGRRSSDEKKAVAKETKEKLIKETT